MPRKLEEILSREKESKILNHTRIKLRPNSARKKFLVKQQPETTLDDALRQAILPAIYQKACATHSPAASRQRNSSCGWHLCSYICQGETACWYLRCCNTRSFRVLTEVPENVEIAESSVLLILATAGPARIASARLRWTPQHSRAMPTYSSRCTPARRVTLQ